MTAKPQLMAAQTDAPDDLIAELARLMADDAKTNPPDRPAAPTVRIPGDKAAASAQSSAPRLDLSASSKSEAVAPSASPVRIPGGDTSTGAAGLGTGSTDETVEPFVFNFDLPERASAAPIATSVPASEPAGTQAAPPAPVASEQSSIQKGAPELDQDSLADLIAAELAADLGPEPQGEPIDQPVAAPQEDSAGPDRFGVPPVFGLDAPTASTPQTSQPQESMPSAPAQAQASPQPPRPDHTVDAASNEISQEGSLDPLAEIERLVGPAVHMGSTAAPASPSPALRSLATPVIPDAQPAAQPKPEAEPESAPAVSEPAASVSSVDEAILAAAAATGAHVEWVNDGDRDASAEVESDRAAVQEPTPVRERRINRAVLGPLVAVGLLVVAGGGLYWALGQGGVVTGPAPLLVADTTPTKEVPEVDTAESTPQSVVFNEISGDDTGAEEQIVSRDQADGETVAAASSVLSGSGVLSDTSSETVDPNQDGLVNRKVRTVTVRPDGTIVSGEDSLAGSAILPVDRPNVPEVPGADFETPDLIAGVAAEAATPAAETSPAIARPVAEPGTVVTVVDTAGATIDGRNVTIPMMRPDDFSSIASAAIAAANTAPIAQPAVAPTSPVVTTATGSAAAYVQMASQRSEADAQQTAQAINTRYGLLFGGASPEIRRVDLGERGVYYRVLVPAPSRESAVNICANVKAAGGDCLLL